LKNDGAYDPLVTPTRPIQVAPLAPADLAPAEQLLDRVVHGRRQIRLREVVDVLSLDGFGAWYDDRLVGVVTWTVERDPLLAELAVLAIDADHRGHGVGGRLTDAAVAAATAAGCTTMWLVTTNDNLDALRLYQRHGFRLAEIRVGAVDESRLEKPSISLVGNYGIPIHDELILERSLR
jgi:ribosomal protein S18 acetylase RimI-like enzyme